MSKRSRIILISYITLVLLFGVQLYSDEWVMTKSGESVGLTNPDDVKVLIWQKASPASRMLTKWHEESDTWPVLNMPGPWRKSAQQAGADQPATASESKPEGADKPQPESKAAPPVAVGRPLTFARSAFHYEDYQIVHSVGGN